jgi:hypothetical protein
MCPMSFSERSNIGTSDAPVSALRCGLVLCTAPLPCFYFLAGRPGPAQAAGRDVRIFAAANLTIDSPIEFWIWRMIGGCRSGFACVDMRRRRTGLDRHLCADIGFRLQQARYRNPNG